MRQAGDFKTWSFRVNPLIGKCTYLVAFPSCWPCFYVFSIPSTTTRLKNFLIITAMLRGPPYSHAVPHLDLLYKVLADFSGFHREMKWYGYWSAVIGCLGMYFA